jgi:catechol 2,3-dioxygenase-like lactoylglutathione lyase family enzyme
MIQFQSSVIFVKDIARSRQFYEGLLQQKVAMDHGLNVGFEAGFALWQVEHARQTIFGAAGDTGQLGQRNFEIYFETDELDPIYQQITATGVPFVHPIHEQPWGQRVFRVYDPDGHIVEVGEPMPVVILRFLSMGMSPEAIAQRTSMPLSIVQQIIQTANAGATV